MLERRNNTSANRPEERGEEEEEEDGGGSTEGCEDMIYIFNVLSPIKGKATL